MANIPANKKNEQYSSPFSSSTLWINTLKRYLPYCMIWLAAWTLYFACSGNFPFAAAKFQANGNEIPLKANPRVRSQIGPWSHAPKNQTYLAALPWRPWFFVSGAGVLFLSLTMLIQDKLESAKVSRSTRRKMRELEQAALRSQMNPHFIFNALNSIQSFVAKGDRQTANSYLARFAKLMRSTLYLANAQKITLHEELDMLENYLELEQMRFQNVFRYQITSAENLDLFDVEIPPMLVQPFIENAILHGLTPKNGPGMIHVDFRLEGRHLAITVKDNGIGLEQSLRHKPQGGPQHRPIGLMLTRRRLELLEKTPVESTLDIFEEKDKYGQVAGTTVKLHIRLEEEPKQRFSLAAFSQLF